jgi:hypothetical protein
LKRYASDWSSQCDSAKSPTRSSKRLTLSRIIYATGWTDTMQVGGMRRRPVITMGAQKAVRMIPHKSAMTMGLRFIPA